MSAALLLELAEFLFDHASKIKEIANAAMGENRPLTQEEQKQVEAAKAALQSRVAEPHEFG